MKRLPPLDPVMLTCVLVMLATSLLMVASSSMSISAVRYGDAYRIIGHWAVYVPVGLVLMWAASRVEVDWWRAMVMPLLGLALLLMTLVLIPGIGMEINGARRWYSMLGLTLQPVELLKPVIVIYMAYYMTAFPERMKNFSTGIAPMMVVLGVAVVLLLLQPDFGSSALLVALCFSMWFVGGVPLRHLLLTVGSVLPVGVVIMLAEPYRVKRFLSFVDPWADPLGSGYQLLQSMVAFGVGGVHGAGLGQGVQKLFYLPEPFTDFISAVIGEELGMPGMFGLILLFGVLLMRGMQLARKVPDVFQRLVVVGCVTLLATTFFINLGAAMGVMPTKGMPMPLMSYGGSALFGSCILLGLIFSVQRHQPMNAHRETVHTQRGAAGKRSEARV
ncbi:MAG: putative lipid II flippase FtsW [Zetaproteobacteria bacterium CG12_big_fil_rev_8_21_14_0_65_55_1124]|nr:MAG: putative lipid II flippase FtsW [Zetaproteobacteria bacterium CG1_02_55_237]PIS19909.1 MAG: putative lipid II flippase FtsW [Zetaproteobacteria bacterium CG08_land_8_20_14_0_20_55_17]PIW43668.1 MAG: putative lipid II flippase FtsW [Zetaproteobacteria bacterium CG12_big_fil_rev_8_21_14_0_65_55_1124]PIY52663.1 MAG: putative lipid II flippase FtsW [Zetaproteobacteria bacterium CG_4_10_14_0_8_um_filter_55_43]PIZ37847.1 MAG: putative lipid II flippase FtsW [Zetaproteobacteria bacterium CG_4_